MLHVGWFSFSSYLSCSLSLSYIWWLSCAWCKRLEPGQIECTYVHTIHSNILIAFHFRCSVCIYSIEIIQWQINNITHIHMLYTIKQALEATNTDIYREMMIYRDWTEKEASERREKKMKQYERQRHWLKRRRRKRNCTHGRCYESLTLCVCARWCRLVKEPHKRQYSCVKIHTHIQSEYLRCST